MKFWQVNSANGTDEKEMGQGWRWGASVGLPRAHSKSKRKESVGKEAGRSHGEEAAGEGSGLQKCSGKLRGRPGLALALVGRAPKAEG